LKAILGIAEDVQIVFINQEHKVGNHREKRSWSTKDCAQKKTTSSCSFDDVDEIMKMEIF
jgi:hypothetical protein